MCLLPGPAEDVDSKDSRMKGLWKQKETWSMFYHVKANQNFL